MSSSIIPPITSDSPLWDQLMGNYTFACLMVAVKLDITGLINQGVNTHHKLTKQLQLSSKGLNLYLLILSHLGYIQAENGTLSNTSLATEYLDKNSDYFWGEVLNDPNDIYDINHLDKKILTSLKREYELECNHRSVTDMWQHNKMDNQSAAAFTHLMHSQGFASAVSATKKGIFNAASTLLDAGAGSGAIALAFCDNKPQRKALLFDLPPVCEIAKEYVTHFDQNEQITLVPGDFFSQDWPEGVDGICFSNVLHDWQADTCQMLLNKAFHTLPTGGLIFIHDMLFDKSSLTPSLFCFHLFMNHGAQLFTEKQLYDLLTEAGFIHCKTQASLGYFSVVSAQKT